jgi:RNA polymerase sigma-70 factor (ECF subfamily)
MSTISETKQVRTSGPAAWSAKSDEDLLLAYRDHGERRAFEELVHRYERELYSYLRRYLGDSTMAEDAFQQTFLQLHLKCDLYEAGRPVRPWLYTIATNQAIDTQRRSKRHRLVSLDRRNERAGEDEVGTLLEMLVNRDPSPGAQMESAERREWIRQAIAQLPETLRAAVLLVYYQGLKYREAAEILEVPVGTVKSRLHTAILKLNEQWNRAEQSGAE